MNPTDVLKNEHIEIKSMLKVATIVADNLEAGEAVDPEDLTEIVVFIKEFADTYHHGKEEELLFEAMEESGIPAQGGPIGMMLIEHDQGREYVRAMSQAAANYRDGDISAGKDFAANARGYVALLDQHIDKEDNILYQMAEMHLSDEQKSVLNEAFAQVETKKIGPGRREELLHILAGLKVAYFKEAA